MREDRKRNQEFVYQTMESYYKETQKWTEDLTIGEVQSRVNVTLRLLHEEVGQILPKEVPWKKMGYRVVLRHLGNLAEEGRVRQTRRGRYTIDVAVQKRQNIASEYRQLLSINAAELSGHYSSTLLGKKGLIIPFNPAYALRQTALLRRKIYERRLSRHGDEEVAKAETDIWIDSFMNSVNVEIGSTGAPFSFLSGKMMTTERQEMGPALLGAIAGKRISKKGYGVDALVFQSATEIMYRLLTDLIDPESLKAFGNSDVVVKICFNPLKFLQTKNNLKEPFEMKLNSKPVRKLGLFPTKTRLISETKKRVIFRWLSWRGFFWGTAVSTM
jgi:hypothetical protein